ncbi:MAG: hypothetical protein A2365_01080, partial [Candidatus Nealsonbacteria bacterium RIFOXYB1_FULL_40_15]
MKNLKYIAIALILLVSATISAQDLGNIELPGLPSMSKPVQQMTRTELQQKIQEIVSVIQQLQAILANLSPTQGGIQGIPSGFSFSGTMKEGMSSDNIKYLQIVLNSDPETRIADSGWGSPAKETIFYGAKTTDAVRRLQVKYRSQISETAGYQIQATGYAGPATISKLNQILAEKRTATTGGSSSPGPTCGDSIIQEGEVCDKANLNSNTCQSLGYSGGILKCSSSCKYDTSFCSGGTAGGGSSNQPTSKPGTSCTPKTCSSLNYQCGTHLDGCGSAISCGTCNSGYSCQSGKCIQQQSKPTGPYCGDNACNGTETCSTCSQDCGACVSGNSSITLNSPTSTIWTQDNDVDFNVAFNTPSPSYGFIDWDNSLVGWWRGEGNTNDESGNGNHGMFMSLEGLEVGYLWPYEIDPSFDVGKFGQSFNFKNNQQWMDVGDPEDFNFKPTDSFSISFWVKSSRFSGMKPIAKSNKLYIKSSSGLLNFYVGGRQCRTSIAVDVLNWTHVTAIYDGNELFIYINGINRSGWREGEVGSSISTTESLRIGQGEGLIDDLMIFSSALSPAEIQNLFQAQSLTKTFEDLPELVAYPYTIHTVSSTGAKSTISSTIKVDVPNTPPTVSLTSPANNTRSSSASQTFTCTASNVNDNTDLATATLYWNHNGTFRADTTQAISGDSKTISFAKSGLSGSISWNCYVCDTANNCAFADANNTVVIGTTDYYVSPSGNDNNPGTLSQPFKTVQKCADIAMPGETCYLRQGTYRETVTPANSGNSTAPITFKSYPGERATISGADILTGPWILHEGNIYKTTMNWDLGKGKNQIFVNGEAMMEARWPNAEDVMKPNFNNIDSGSVNGSTVTINSSSLTQPSGYWGEAIVHAIWDPRYHAGTGIVTQYKPGTITLDFQTITMGDINKYGIFYLTGHLNALDKAEEWYHDNNNQTLYFWTPTGSIPSNVEAKRRQQIFNLNEKLYINIEDIDIFAGNIVTDENSSHVNIIDIKSDYPSHYTVIDEGNMGAGGKGRRNTGIVLDGNYNLIKNSIIRNSAGNGVSLIGNNSTVDNCEIYNVNYVVTDCAAISTGSEKAENNNITNNLLYNAGRELIIHNYAGNLKILRNEIYGTRYGGEPYDLGVIYAIGTDGKGTEIAYNYIHDYMSIGIYLDGSNSGFNIHHNIIEKSPYAGNFIPIFLNYPSTNNQVYNNTVTGEIRVKASENNNIVFKNNIANSFAEPNYAVTTKSNNINLLEIDPNIVFVNWNNGLNGDYHLRIDSPAVDKGANVGLSEDIEGNPIPRGNAPDIGAYESSYVFVECSSGQTQSCSTGLLGICSYGTKTCSSTGSWGPCVQNAQPSEEICGDTLDNDCDGQADENCQTDWYNSSWNYRKKITIQNANVDSDLTNFPLYVDITADTDIGAHAQADGDDILFTKGDGITQIPHEEKSFTITDGSATGHFWVNMPTIYSASTTDIYVYYGNSSASNQEQSAQVWKSKEATGVWLMKEGSGTTVADSSGNGNTGSFSGSPSWENDYVNLSTAGTDFISTPDSPELSVFNAFSFHLLLAIDSSQSTWVGLTGKDGTNFYFQHKAGDGDTNWGHSQLGDGLTSASNLNGNLGYDDDLFHFWTLTWDGLETDMYVDGVRVAGESATGSMDLSGAVMKLGKADATGTGVIGKIKHASIHNYAFTVAETKFMGKNLTEADNEL